MTDSLDTISYPDYDLSMSGMRRSRFLLVTSFFQLLAIPVLAAPTANETVKVGVLKFPFHENRENKISPPAKALPLFRKLDGSWQPTTENEESWDVILDGKLIGKANSKNPSAFKKKPSAIDFWAWEGTIRQKAFALVSGGFADDPNRWKPWKPSAGDLHAKREQFIKLISRDSESERRHFRCPGFYLLEDSKKDGPEKCKATEKIQLRKAYADKNGLIIAQFLIETDKEGDFEGTTERINKWVYFSTPENMSAKSLFPEDKELWDAYLIEAADFDRSGESKLLFEVSGYNMSGYFLFDSHLKKLAETRTSFH